MRKVLAVLVIMMFVVSFTVPAVHAEEAGLEKLKAGITTFFKSPTNVYDSLKEEYEESEFKPFGLFGGLMKGLFYTGVDMVSGLVDTLTFPVDLSGE